ncbi:MAG: BCD family MFS transporter [Kouleothrix sp.]|jgi:BCD family chlorophyll transporter-like MFS transporter|nr:BCD family MFS transporter [Kouleothrix sp.]
MRKRVTRRPGPFARLLQPFQRLKAHASGWLERHGSAAFWLRVLRLGLFQFGMGLTLAPITGTLNRVLIDNMRIPAVLVGLLIAIHYFVSPVRALIGFRSDQQRAKGRWRTPYIVLGAILTFGGLNTSGFSLVLLSGKGSLPYLPALIICLLIFLAYGIGVNVLETAYLALVSDLTPPKERGRVLAVLWMMLVLGTIASSVLLGSLLVNYSDERLISILQSSALIFLILSVVSLWNQERLRPDGTVVGYHDQVRVRMSLGQSLALLWHQQVLRRLFAILFLATAAFASHDILLEPYGGQVLHMSISATTGLTALWGLAMLVAIPAAGWLLWRGFSPVLPIMLGSAVGALGFLVVAIASDASMITPFRSGVWLIGMGRGLFIVGSLALVMALTDRSHAGLFLGLWGVMQALAQGLGAVGGGLARDLAERQTGSVVLGYTAVYGTAMFGLLIALLLVVAMRLTRLRADSAVSPWQGLQDIPADQIMY